VVTFPEFAPPLDPVNVPVQRCPVAREQASHRVLIFRAGAYGDILMASPLLAALRAAWPDAHLTWMVEAHQCQAIDAHPAIDELILWNSLFWKKMVRRLDGVSWATRAIRFRKRLRARAYDTFVSLQPEEWPLLTDHVGAATRIGIFDAFGEPQGTVRTHPNRRRFTASFAQDDLPPHRTDQYLLALRPLGVPVAERRMRLGFTTDDAAVVARWLAENGVTDTDHLVVLAPRTTWESKCWPEDRFVALARALGEREGRRIVLIGSGSERACVARIAAQLPSPPLVASGNLSFRQMAALIARAAVVVSGDTGPMHVAAAVDTPFVALFGPTGPVPLAPIVGRGTVLSHPVPCGPCYHMHCPNVGDDYHRCLRRLTIEEVLAATEAALDSSPVGTGAR
jgi:ADP-heptose:LPS heptosyltransferase